MLKQNTEPGLIAVSTIAYRLLLAFYPPRFRQEYGPFILLNGWEMVLASVILLLSFLLIQRLGSQVPIWFSFTIFSLMSIGLATLGYVLQADVHQRVMTGYDD